jgi:hypothetical protein
MCVCVCIGCAYLARSELFKDKTILDTSKDIIYNAHSSSIKWINTNFILNN